MQDLIVAQLSNPLTKEHDYVKFEYNRQSVYEITQAIIPEETEYRVYKNGQLITQDDVEFFEATLVTDEIFIVPLVQGDSMKSILGIVAMIALSVVTAGMGAGLYLAAGAFNMGLVGANMVMGLSYIINAAIMIGGSMLINQLTAPDMPGVTGQAKLEPGSSYSWNPHTTQMEGITIPHVFGRMKIKSGNVINAFRRPAEGSDTANDLYILTSYGEGPIKGIYEVAINDQYDYEEHGIQVDRRLGTVSQGRMAGFDEGISDEAQNDTLIDTAGEYSYILGSGFDKVGFTISFPQGLHNFSETGSRIPSALDFKARLVNTTRAETTYFAGVTNPSTFGPGELWSFGYYQRTWVPVGGGEEGGDDGYYTDKWRQITSKTITGLDPDDLEPDPQYPQAHWRYIKEGTGIHFYDTVSEDFVVRYNRKDAFDIDYQVATNETDEYTLYVERITDDTPPGGSQTGPNTSVLTSIKKYTYDKFAYPRSVLMSLRSEASEKFSGGLEYEALFEGKILEVYNGTSWDVEYNTNPAWVTWHILTSPVIDYVGGVYTVLEYRGMDPSKLNLADFYEWAQLCDELVPDSSGGTEKRFEFNGVFDSQTNVWDAAQKVAALTRAYLYFTGNSVRVSTEKKVLAADTLVTEANYITDSFKTSYTSLEDRASVIEIRFLDEDQNYEQTVLSLYDSSIATETNKITIDAFGTTSASQAWRIAKFLLNKNKYLYQTVSFDMFVDFIDFAIGDIIDLQSNTVYWGEGTRVKDTSLNTIIIDGLMDDGFYLAVGVSQGVIDSWKAGGSGVYDPSVDTNTDIYIRNVDNTVQIYDIYGVEYDGSIKETTIILNTTPTASTDDICALSYSGATPKRLRVLDIADAGELQATITAIEYKDEIFDSTDIATEPNTTPYNPSVLFDSVTDIVVSSHMYYDDNDIPLRGLHVSWTPGEDYAGAVVRVYGSADGVEKDDLLSTSYAGLLNTYVDINNIALATYYIVSVAALSTAGASQPKIEAPEEVYTPVDTNDSTLDYMVNGVNNLIVVNGNLNAGDYEYTDADIVISWDPPNNINWLSTYIVRIYEYGTTNVLTAHYTLNNNYVFMLTHNKLTTGGPHRNVDIGVVCVDKFGNEGSEVKIKATNDQIAQVQNVVVAGALNLLSVSWDLLNDTDLLGYEIHLGTTTGFTPNAGTLYGTVDGQTNTATFGAPDDDYFIVVGAYDRFGKTGIIYSSEVSYTHDSSITITPTWDSIVGIPVDLKSQEPSTFGSLSDLSPRVMMAVATLYYYIWEDDTTISVNGVSTITGNAGDKGTTATLQKDDIIESNRPVSLLCGVANIGGYPPSFTIAGKYFSIRQTRNSYNYMALRIYATQSDANVKIFVNETDYSVTPDYTLTTTKGVCVDQHVSTADGEHVRIHSDSPILVIHSCQSTAITMGNFGDTDHLIMFPDSHSVVEPRASSSTTTKYDESGTLVSATGYIYSEDTIFGSFNAGDGAGSDAEKGIPELFLGDRYAIPYASVEDYSIVAIEPTIVTVYKISDDSVYQTHDLSTASKTIPGVVTVGTQSGAGTPAIDTEGIYFVGTGRFAVRSNLLGDGEETLIGWDSKERLQLGLDSMGIVASALRTKVDTVEEGATVGADWGVNLNGIPSFGYASLCADPTNLAADPHFERTTAIDDELFWIVTNGAEWGASYGENSTGGIKIPPSTTANGYLRVADGSGGGAEVAGDYLYQPTAIGEEFYVVIRAKASVNIVGNLGVALWHYDSNLVYISGASTVLIMTDSDNDDTWRTYSAKVTVAHSTTAYVRLGFYAYGGDVGEFYIDNVYIGPTEPGADITANNTANDTTYVNGTLAATVASNAANAIAATNAMVDDLVFSAQEKRTWQIQWPGMDKNYDNVIAAATAYGIQAETVFTNFTAEHAALETFLLTTHSINNDPPTDSALSGTTFKDNVEDFYDTMQLAVNRLAEYQEYSAIDNKPTSFAGMNIITASWRDASTHLLGAPARCTVSKVVGGGVFGEDCWSIENTDASLEAYAYLAVTNSNYNIPISNDQDYVVSCYIKTTNQDGVAVQVHTRADDGGWLAAVTGAIGAKYATVDMADGWVRYFYVANVLGYTGTAPQKVLLRFDVDDPGAIVYFSSPMVEPYIAGMTGPSPYILPNSDLTETAIGNTVETLSGGLKVTDTTTLYDDYVHITGSGINFYVDQNLYSAVKRIESGTQTNGTPVVFGEGSAVPFKDTPHVILAPANTPTYDKDTADTSFELQFTPDGLDVSGFTPKAILTGPTGVDSTQSFTKDVNAAAQTATTTNSGIDTIIVKFHNIFDTTVAWVDFGGDEPDEDWNTTFYKMEIRIEYALQSTPTTWVNVFEDELYHRPALSTYRLEKSFTITGGSGSDTVTVRITKVARGAYVGTERGNNSPAISWKDMQELGTSSVEFDCDIKWLAIERG